MLAPIAFYDMRFLVLNLGNMKSTKSRHFLLAGFFISSPSLPNQRMDEQFHALFAVQGISPSVRSICSCKKHMWIFVKFCDIFIIGGIFA